MPNTVIGILFIIIIITSGGLLYFNSRLIDKKTKMEHSWLQLYCKVRHWSTLIQQISNRINMGFKCKEEPIVQLEKCRESILNEISYESIIAAAIEMRRIYEDTYDSNVFMEQIKEDNEVMEGYHHLNELEISILERQQEYNDLVLRYNAQITYFPNNWIAMFLGVKKLSQLQFITETKNREM